MKFLQKFNRFSKKIHQFQYYHPNHQKLKSLRNRNFIDYSVEKLINSIKFNKEIQLILFHYRRSLEKKVD